MGSKAPNWLYSPSKWHKWLINRVANHLQVLGWSCKYYCFFYLPQSSCQTHQIPVLKRKSSKSSPRAFAEAVRKHKTAQLKRREGEVVRNLETQQETPWRLQVYCFRKGEKRRPKIGDHDGVVEIHDVCSWLNWLNLLCRNQAQVSKQPLWLQRTAGNIGRPGLEQFQLAQDGGTKPTKLYMAVSGGWGFPYLQSNMLVMVRSHGLRLICLEEWAEDSLVWKARQKVAVNGHFGGSQYLPPCVQNLAALHFPFSRMSRYLVSTRIFRALCYGLGPFLLGILLFNYLIDLKLINASSIPGVHGFPSILKIHSMAWMSYLEPTARQPMLASGRPSHVQREDGHLCL